MSDDPLEEWRKANKEYFGNSTYRDRKKRFHEWMVSMWKAGHMPVEIRDIWVHDTTMHRMDRPTSHMVISGVIAAFAASWASFRTLSCRSIKPAKFGQSAVTPKFSP